MLDLDNKGTSRSDVQRHEYEHPLVTDLDGTLVATDTLVESAFLLLRRNPAWILAMFFWLLRGKQYLKHEIAMRVSLNMAALPWRSEFIEWLQGERAKGRRIILATAAHQTIANAVAVHLPIFDLVLGTSVDVNLKGKAKLTSILQHVGDRFVYAGDSKADLPIWAASAGAITVGATLQLRKQVEGIAQEERAFSRLPGGWKFWLKAIRVHQWLKNVLLFVPMLTAFSTLDSAQGLPRMLLSFLSYSLTASATYILNDLYDLENDRMHPRKRHRPFASGALQIPAGLVAVALLLAAGMGLAYWVSVQFLAMVCGYVVLTTLYSLKLKMHTLMDVVMLAVLYTYRVLSGAVALKVVVTPALLGFSIFIFLSLALVKRCGELLALQGTGMTKIRGRDYRVVDLQVLWPLGTASSLCAVVVFGLYIGASETQARYAGPELLWLAAIGLIHWLARLWVKTARGEMRDDPIVYALLDRGSRKTILALVGVVLLAHFISIRSWF